MMIVLLLRSLWLVLGDFHQQTIFFLGFFLFLLSQRCFFLSFILRVLDWNLHLAELVEETFFKRLVVLVKVLTWESGFRISIKVSLFNYNFLWYSISLKIRTRILLRILINFIFLFQRNFIFIINRFINENLFFITKRSGSLRFFFNFLEFLLSLLDLLVFTWWGRILKSKSFVRGVILDGWSV